MSAVLTLSDAPSKTIEAALAARPTHVRLERCKLGARALSLLAANDALVSTLQVSQCRLDDGAIEALLGTTLPSQLAVLDLSTNPRMSTASMATS